MSDEQSSGVPFGTGYSAEPEPSFTVSAVPVSIPNAETLPAISMWQPYASLMFVWDRERGEFAKAFETRSHKLPDRLINEWVIIHATAKFAPEESITSALNDLCYDMFGCGYNYSLPRGAAIGRVRFGVPVPTGELAAFQPETEIAAGDWTPGRWAWPVMEAELFAMPVPMKGAQGWWRCPASAIEAQRAETVKLDSVHESAVGSEASETPQNTPKETSHD
jgi:hypothetical protein